MSKICISKCASDARIPMRATYENLYKWPESDAEFMKSATMQGGGRRQRREVDSVSCRQIYLRSYTFSRKETVPERTIKCFGKVKERILVSGRKEVPQRRLHRRKRRCLLARRVREFSRAAFLAIFRRLLLCTTTVDVADGGGRAV